MLTPSRVVRLPPAQRPTTLAQRRATLLAVVALVALLLAVGCADVDRTVVRRHTISDGAGGRQPALTWESDRYPTQERGVDDQCWDAATIGMPPPESCLTPLNVVIEGNAYGRAPWLALTGSLIVVGALLWFALRRIAWKPEAEPVAAPQLEHGDSPADDVVRLMRVVDDEKDSQAVAEAAGRDVPNPGPVGAAVGVTLLVSLILLFGYGTTLGWAIFTALAMLLVLGIVETLLLLPTPPRLADSRPSSARMLFLAGFAVALLALSLAGTIVPTPLLDLHGVAWPA